MRALIINAVCGIKSTGRICIEQAEKLELEGYEVKIAFGREYVPEQYTRYAVRIGNNLDVLWHAFMSKVFDQRGLWSKNATRLFLRWLDEYNPDLIWLHNIHDHFINIEMLFNWIKAHPDKEIRWTQHDCWAFTGSCFHYTYSKCEQWKNGCKKCPSKSLISNPPLICTPKKNYKLKKELFLNIRKMCLILPSYWMDEQIKMSFLKKYPTIVTHNIIDTEVFCPTPSDFKEKMELQGKKIILGVASAWSDKKGFSDFIKLSTMLDEHEQIVLVGVTKKQRKKLPPSIISIERTDNIQSLVKIYNAADVFVNLTYEDTYPTVNLEANACGTVCISYRTGGSTESVLPENVIDVGDFSSLLKRIREVY